MHRPRAKEKAGASPRPRSLYFHVTPDLIRGPSARHRRKRVRAIWVAEKSREAEAAALRRAAHYEQTGDWRFDHEQPALPSAVEGPSSRRSTW
jgi:hypothetical protein